MTSFYVGGMYLNDAFDRATDRRERPHRPIPSGAVSAQAVFAAGFAMLALGVALMAVRGPAPALAGVALAAAIVGYDSWHKGNKASPVIMGLCRCLIYVGAGAFAAGPTGAAAALLPGLAVLAHTAGLTYAAKQESLDRIDRLWPLAILAAPLLLTVPTILTLWFVPFAWLALAGADLLAANRLRRRAAPGDVPRAVASLIAALSLVDALLVAPLAPGLALVCWGGYALTRAFQRVIPGT